MSGFSSVRQADVGGAGKGISLRRRSKIVDAEIRIHGFVDRKYFTEARPSPLDSLIGLPPFCDELQTAPRARALQAFLFFTCFCGLLGEAQVRHIFFIAIDHRT